jgi:hypothetical protein
MGALAPRNNGYLTTTQSPMSLPATRRERREVQRETQELVRRTGTISRMLDASMIVTEHAMDNIMTLDTRRRQLAGNDPVLNEILGQVEMNYVHAAGRIQNRMFNDLGF